MNCPNCNKELQIIQNTNWDNLTTSYYPICNNCHWTTRQEFDSKKAINIYLRLKYGMAGKN